MKRGLILRKEFSDSFNIEVNETPSVLSEEQYDLNHKLMTEEVDEYLEACENEDIGAIADALGDQLYVWMGMVLSHGLQSIIEEVFVEIHKSNMSKLDKDGKPIINGENDITDESKPIGKVLKGDAYFPPKIDAILDKMFQNELTKKFLDDELKEHLDKQYERREEMMKTVIKENLTDAEWKRFVKYEKDADFFSSKFQLVQERTSFDQTRFGVKIDGETTWISEKQEGEYK